MYNLLGMIITKVHVRFHPDQISCFREKWNRQTDIENYDIDIGDRVVLVVVGGGSRVNLACEAYVEVPIAAESTLFTE